MSGLRTIRSPSRPYLRTTAQEERALDVGAQERLRILNGVVVVGLRHVAHEVTADEAAAARHDDVVGLERVGHLDHQSSATAPDTFSNDSLPQQSAQSHHLKSTH